MFTRPTLILAPMAGVTDYPFRCLVRRYSNPDLVISEMVASQAMIRNIKKSLQRNCQSEEKTAVQIAGNDPEVMAEAARMSVDLGACLIDINMGCPVKKIAINSYAGCALMKDEKLAAQVFRAIVKAVPVPVTVKMRKGWDENTQNALQLAHIAKSEGLSYVTIHARTRTQLFTGKADWDFISHIQNAIDFPVIGNGDIFTEEDAHCVMSKAAGIMVGRGCYGRPWFLGQIRHFLTYGTHCSPPSFTEQHRIVHEHFDHLLTYYGKEQGVLLARKHLAWYSKGLPGACDFRIRVFQEHDPVPLKLLIDTFYQALV